MKPVTIEDGRVVTHEAATTNSVSASSSVGDAAREAAVCAHGKMAPPCGCFVFVQPAPTAPPPAAPSEAREEVYGTAAEWKRAWEADTASLRARLATAEAERAYLADRVDALNGQQDGLMQDRRTAEAERDRLLRQIARVRACPCISGASCDELDTLYDLAAGRAPSTGTTPP